MPSNDGYLKIVAMMQKFFDQAISGNWSYNPEHYPNNEVPLTEIAQDFLKAYKYGHKTAYYHNTYDGKSDEMKSDSNLVNSLVDDILSSSEEEEICDTCSV
jgi:ribonucleoside-diphosphate reductase alpha chain